MHVPALRFPYLLGLVTLLPLLGCAGSTPATAPAPPRAYSGTVPTMADLQAQLPADQALLMAAEVLVDRTTLTAEMLPLRTGQITFGAQFPDLFVSNYLQLNPCTTCVRLDSVLFDPIEDYITLKFGVRHPFPAFGAGATRADLDAFDLRGIVLIPEPTWVGHPQFDFEVASGVTGRGDFFIMKNADGYTPALRGKWTDSSFVNPANASELSTLNPFKAWQGDGVERRFRQGAAFENQNFVFDVSRSTNELRFLIAFVVNYGTPIRDKPDQAIPQYFTPEFNMKEAYAVRGNTLFGSEMTWKDVAGSAIAEVFVSDHQRGLPVKGADLAWDDPPGTVTLPSNTNRVRAQIPAISDTIYETVAPVSGAGTIAAPYRFVLLIQNTNAASFGTYPMMMQVFDERATAGQTFQMGTFTIPYIDDFEREDPITATGWTVQQIDPGTGPGWGAFSSGTGDGVYFDDNNNLPYENSVALTLNSPSIDLTWSGPSPVLEITHSFDTEPQADGCGVFLSTNGGLNYDYSQLIPVIAGTGYNTTPMNAKNLPFDMLAYKEAFTGNSGGKVITQFDLSAAAGKKDVRVQFLFSSDSFINGTTSPNFFKGWTIFGIKILP